jgi:N-acetylglucosamine-6-sulfatase
MLVLALTAGVALLLLSVLARAGALGGVDSDAVGPGAPNVLVVMTDDQTVAEMQVMPRVRLLIGDRGTRFENSFTNYPLCCPSRATFITGQYAHNHGVRSGSGFLDLTSSNTLPVWLQNAGYRTGHVGKYINGYGAQNAGGPKLVPPGWDEWYAAVPDNQAVYDYGLNQNGALVHYGSAATDFKGDVLTRKAVGFIRRNAPSPVPFFLSVGYVAPHTSPGVAAGVSAGCNDGSQPIPAPRDLGRFAQRPLPRPPSFNEPDVSDKPADVRLRPALDRERIGIVRDRYRCRLESLLHVDRGVAEMLAALNDSGELDRTLIVFTSDNGFLLGQHRLVNKIYPYEESIRVPTLIRGPGVPIGKTVSSFASNADLAPTILDAADAAPGRVVDGVSLFELIGDQRPSRDLLLESYIDKKWFTPYTGVRTERYAYIAYSSGERELYDLDTDPYQLVNRFFDPAYGAPRAWLHERLRELRDCRGSSCRTHVGEPPPPNDPLPPQPRG